MTHFAPQRNTSTLLLLCVICSHSLADARAKRTFPRNTCWTHKTQDSSLITFRSMASDFCTLKFLAEKEKEQKEKLSGGTFTPEHVLGAYYMCCNRVSSPSLRPDCSSVSACLRTRRACRDLFRVWEREEDKNINTCVQY